MPSPVISGAPPGNVAVDQAAILSAGAQAAGGTPPVPTLPAPNHAMVAGSTGASQADIERQVSQFFDRIQPPPLNAQTWLDNWLAPGSRGTTGSRAHALSVSPEVREGSSPAPGDDPGGAPAGTGSDPDPQSASPEGIAAQYAAMHGWLDAHPAHGDDGSIDAYADLRLFSFASSVERGLYAGLQFGATPGIAQLGTPALQPLQGLHEGMAQLGWS